MYAEIRSRAAPIRSASAIDSRTALFLVLALAAVLRLAGLAHAPLWEDEVATKWFASLSWHDLLLGVGRLETNPPGFYAVEKLWTGLYGSSGLALRLPSALAGIAAVAVVWATTRASFGSGPAIWTSLLLATHPQHLLYAREARTYAVLFLTIAIAVHAARRLSGWSGAGGRMTAVVLGLAVGSATYLHYTGVIAATSVFIAAVVTALRADGSPLHRIRLLFGAGLLGALVAAPALLSAAMLAGDDANNASWITVPDATLASVIVLFVLVSLKGLNQMPIGLGLTFFTLGGLVVAAAMRWAARRAVRDLNAWFYLTGLVAALALMVGISQVKPVLIERTLLFTLVFFLPLLGSMLAAMPGSRRNAVLAVLLVIGFPGLLRVFEPLRLGEDWPRLGAGLQAEVSATGWPVIAYGGFEAVALDDTLPADSPARVRVTMTSAVGTGLNDEVSRYLGATPVSMRANPVELCEALGHPDGAILVLRKDVLSPMKLRIGELLAAAGGTMDGGTAHSEAVQNETWASTGDALSYQRWPGVCTSDRTFGFNAKVAH